MDSGYGKQIVDGVVYLIGAAILLGVIVGGIISLAVYMIVFK